MATSQLAGNAFGRIVPGGGAAAGALQYRMLTQARVPGGAAAAGLTASSLLVFATLLVLPVLAIPALVRGVVSTDNQLVRAAIAGLVLFAAVFAVGAALIALDRPLVLVGRALQSLRNRVLPRRRPLSDLPPRLIAERNLIRRVLGRRWWEALLASVARWFFDYLALLAALAAVGASPRPTLVLLAFVAASILAQIPLTPGGLGFVEAGLTGTLALAGVSGGKAVLASLAYRLASYWLPLPAGLAGWLMHRRRYVRADARMAAGQGS
ncbi:MAG TPA: lysylphosphatidylglycerol synthase transmembrane domain-containing protein [Capillimicrobium sp.]|nr:lysylphosphatidylglycerol synthase transmembrane domain-containing protein [Capillimicrobium sp.]